MSRDEATLSESLNRVTVSRTEGNTEKSSGFRTNMDMSRMTMETVMLSDSSKSMIRAGRGTTMTMRIPTTPRPISIAGFFAQTAIDSAFCTASAIFYPKTGYRVSGLGFRVMKEGRASTAAAARSLQPLSRFFFQAVHVGQDLGNGAIQVLRDCLIHIDRFIQ